LLARRRGVRVLSRGDAGIGESDRCDVNDIAPNEQLLTAALNHVRGVPGRMNGRGQSSNSGPRIGLVFEGLKLPGGYLGCEDVLSAIKHWTEEYGRSLLVCVVQPIV
jgi:hypothetical protein